MSEQMHLGYQQVADLWFLELSLADETWPMLLFFGNCAAVSVAELAGPSKLYSLTRAGSCCSFTSTRSAGLACFYGVIHNATRQAYGLYGLGRGLATLEAIIRRQHCARPVLLHHSDSPSLLCVLQPPLKDLRGCLCLQSRTEGFL